MAWTAQDRRRYASAIQEMVRQGMLVRLASTIDALDPPARIGRPPVWTVLAMLQALWHVARHDRAWRRLPPCSPPHQTVWSRLMGWRRRAVLDRTSAVLVTCGRLAGNPPLKLPITHITRALLALFDARVMLSVLPNHGGVTNGRWSDEWRIRLAGRRACRRKHA